MDNPNLLKNKKRPLTVQNILYFNQLKNKVLPTWVVTFFCNYSGRRRETYLPTALNGNFGTGPHELKKEKIFSFFSSWGLVPGATFRACDE